MDLYTSMWMWQRPEARAFEVDSHWHVDPGPAGERLLPHDVQLTGADEGEPTRLGESLHEVVQNLRDVRDAADEAEQAERLVDHYRRFGSLDLCGHGRPVWHADRENAPDPCLGGDQDLPMALGFIETLEAIITGGMAAAGRRDLPVWVVEHLEPLLEPIFAKSVTAERARDGEGLSPARRRQVMELGATRLLADARVTPRVLWEKGRGPGLALVAETAVGLYALDVARHLGRRDPIPSYRCDQCGGLVRLKRPPGPGEGTYCRRDECQRARLRINKQRSRARAKEAGHVQ